jgi:hypothetical protein
MKGLTNGYSRSAPSWPAIGRCGDEMMTAFVIPPARIPLAALME